MDQVTEQKIYKEAAKYKEVADRGYTKTAASPEIADGLEMIGNNIVLGQGQLENYESDITETTEFKELQKRT